MLSIVQPITYSYLKITGCDHNTLADTIDYIAHRSYMRGVHLKIKLKYTEKAGVVASWLLY